MRNLRQSVKLLLEEGLTQAEIARELGVAGPTVDYHAARIRQEATECTAGPSEPAPNARMQVTTRSAVADLLREGLSQSEIAKRLGLSEATVSYHARRLGAPVDARCARRYDWELVQRYYDRGNSVSDCCTEFGFSRQTWHAAVARGAVRARPAKMPSDEYFVAGVHRSRMHLKRRLLAEGLKEPSCAVCGISEWRGSSLSLALHHINGDRLDNRVVNLELLCPNCHSQTDNFAGRNGRRRRAEELAERMRRALTCGKLVSLSPGVMCARPVGGSAGVNPR